MEVGHGGIARLVVRSLHERNLEDLALILPNGLESV